MLLSFLKHDVALEPVAMTREAQHSAAGALQHADTESLVQLLTLTDSEALTRGVQKLNLGVLPVQCPAFCYKRALRDNKQLSWAAALPESGLVVGGIIAEWEAISLKGPRAGPVVVHIRTLAVDPRYRRRGIARQLMQRVMEQTLAVHAATQSECARPCLQLNVHVANEDGLAFYERLGFVESERVENYYRQLEPSTCIVMRLQL